VDVVDLSNAVTVGAKKNGLDVCGLVRAKVEVRVRAFALHFGLTGHFAATYGQYDACA
jgi:hypothetical protein